MAPQDKFKGLLCIYLFFLKSRWINNAPTLYTKAIQKNTIVDKSTYTQQMGRPYYTYSHPAEIIEFANLWEAIQEITLHPYQDDLIRWRWTTNGEYMQKVLTKSNLNETLPRLRSCRYEKQRPKKCRFLLGHCYTKKNLTTNNLCKRN